MLYIKQYLVALAFFIFLASHATLQTEDIFLPESISCSSSASALKKIKPWTFIVYFAADNDLRVFAARNIKQMAQIGSNENINIVAQLDTRITGETKITRRYYIGQDKIYHLNGDDASSQEMDSGNPKSLISCACWAIQNYPAQNYAFILWNHGTGIIDPGHHKIVDPSTLFQYNPTTHKLDLDRSIGFFDYLHKASLTIDSTTTRQPILDRGICWDYTTKNYLTSSDLDYALKEICNKILRGKKLNIIGFDACLMSMLEIATLVKKYANIMISSQEVELGSSWDYAKIFEPFQSSALSETELATHIVAMYDDAYSNVTNDYTLSAVNLRDIDALENNVNAVAKLLLTCLTKQTNNTVLDTIQECTSKKQCTRFHEPSYVDLHHLYSNLQDNLALFSFASAQEGNSLVKQLSAELTQGKALIENIVFANATGRNLSSAKGLSIYLPVMSIQSSYSKCSFASNNKWYDFLKKYVA